MSNLANGIVHCSVEQANASGEERVVLPFLNLQKLVQVSHFSAGFSLLSLCFVCTTGKHKYGEPYRSVVWLNVFVVKGEKVVNVVEEWTIWKVLEVGESGRLGCVESIVMCEERKIVLE